MKKVLLRVLPGLMVFFSIAHGFEKNLGASANQKIYVDPNQVTIAPEGIFVQLGNDWIATDAVYHDSSGCYISGVSNEWSFYWTCPECGHENSPFNRSCEECGYKPRH